MSLHSRQLSGRLCTRSGLHPSGMCRYDYLSFYTVNVSSRPYCIDVSESRNETYTPSGNSGGGSNTGAIIAVLVVVAIVVAVIIYFVRKRSSGSTSIQRPVYSGYSPASNDEGSGGYRWVTACGLLRVRTVLLRGVVIGLTTTVDRLLFTRPLQRSDCLTKIRKLASRVSLEIRRIPHHPQRKSAGLLVRLRHVQYTALQSPLKSLQPNKRLRLQPSLLLRLQRNQLFQVRSRHRLPNRLLLGLLFHNRNLDLQELCRFFLPSTRLKVKDCRRKP